MLTDPRHRTSLLDAARETIRRTLRANPAAPVGAPPESPPCPDPALEAPAGCFVSLHELRTHRLRGCVGRMDATLPLWQSVANAAVGVLEDPRFRDDPVRLDELPSLSIEISVLSPMRQAATCLDFDPASEGIYLLHGRRSGCFLPQVARETGWTREQLLTRLCVEKMGLAPDAWRDPAARLMVFSTLVIGPEPFEVR